MSDNVEGVMVVIDDSVFFIPRDDLRGYRAPDAVAAQAIAKADEESEVEGFANRTRTATFGVVMSGGSTMLEFSSLMSHGLTASRLC